MNDNPISCLHMHEEGRHTFDTISDDLDVMRRTIGADILDIRNWYIGEHRFAFIVDDCGLLTNRKPTVCDPAGRIMFVGDVLVCGMRRTAADDYEFRDLTEGERDLLRSWIVPMCDMDVLVGVTPRPVRILKVSVHSAEVF